MVLSKYGNNLDELRYLDTRDPRGTISDPTEIFYSMNMSITVGIDEYECASCHEYVVSCILECDNDDIFIIDKHQNSKPLLDSIITVIDKLREDFKIDLSSAFCTTDDEDIIVLKTNVFTDLWFKKLGRNSSIYYFLFLKMLRASRFDGCIYRLLNVDPILLNLMKNGHLFAYGFDVISDAVIKTPTNEFVLVPQCVLWTERIPYKVEVQTPNNTYFLIDVSLIPKNLKMLYNGKWRIAIWGCDDGICVIDGEKIEFDNIFTKDYARFCKLTKNLVLYDTGYKTLYFKTV